jgi:hypothetical protein
VVDARRLKLCTNHFATHPPDGTPRRSACPVDHE